MEETPKPRTYFSPVVMWASRIIKGKVIGKVNRNSRIAKNWERVQNLKILDERKLK
jgi:hypothetical protein|tara:strand:- start:140 stop:307 length:168 start_codon:yes stop_codon:yes gene_type:complete